MCKVNCGSCTILTTGIHFSCTTRKHTDVTRTDLYKWITSIKRNVNQSSRVDVRVPVSPRHVRRYVWTQFDRRLANEHCLLCNWMELRCSGLIWPLVRCTLRISLLYSVYTKGVRSVSPLQLLQLLLQPRVCALPATSHPRSRAQWPWWPSSVWGEKNEDWQKCNEVFGNIKCHSHWHWIAV